jgi:hypothetical protein
MPVGRPWFVRTRIASASDELPRLDDDVSIRPRIAAKSDRAPAAAGVFQSLRPAVLIQIKVEIQAIGLNRPTPGQEVRGRYASQRLSIQSSTNPARAAMKQNRDSQGRRYADC